MTLGLGLSLTAPRAAASPPPPPPPPPGLPVTANLALHLEASPTYCFKDAGKATPCGDGDAIYTWADRSGNGRDFAQATAGSRPLLKADGAGGWYVLFDGVDDYLSYAGVPFAAAPGSVEARIWPGTNATRYPFVALNATEDTGFALLYFSLKAAARQYTALDGSATAASATTFAAGGWSHMAAVFASDASRAAYLAGGGKASNATAVTPAATPSASYLGALGLSTPSYFNGRLSYLVAYTAALSDADVASLATYTP